MCVLILLTGYVLTFILLSLLFVSCFLLLATSAKLIFCYYFMHIGFNFKSTNDTYSVYVAHTDPYLYFSIFFYGVQRVYHRL